MPDSLRSWLWLAVLLLASAALAVARVVALPDRAAPAVAVVLGVTLVVGLTHRAGGRPLVPALVALAYGVACVATTSTVLLAGGAAGTAVAAAALAITATVPAVTLGRALLEVLVAAALATLGGLGAGGFGVRPDQSRFGYVVLGASLLMAFGLVYRLGAGFHGLGRRGYAIAAGALLLLALALAYSSAVGRWGSHDLVVHLHHLRALTRSHLHAVPHPIETLLGVPALCWGTFMRARRRQGWWVCAFGAALTAPSTTRFIVSGVAADTGALAAIYSLVLGAVLGWLLVRLDQAVTEGAAGGRARRAEESTAHRPEPGRFAPLR